MITKGEIGKELKRIDEELRKINRVLYWYIEIPETKQISMWKQEFIKRLKKEFDKTIGDLNNKNNRDIILEDVEKRN